MGIFDNFRKPRQLLLDEHKLQEWPEQLMDHQEIHREIKRFLRELEHVKEDVQRASDALVDTHRLQQVPERAQHIVGTHGRVLDERAQTLVSTAEFTTDPFILQENINKLITALAEFRDQSRKDKAALEEYYGNELQELDGSLQAMEDLVINTGSALDKLEYSTILNIKEMIEQLRKEQRKKQKYERTLNKYLEERSENERKQRKYATKIAEQEHKIRNETTKEALKQIKELEQQHAELRNKYERLVFDTRHYLLKNSLAPTEEMKALFSRLKKETLHMVEREYEKLKNEFKQLAEQLDDLGAEDKKSVVDRLKEAQKSIVQDAQKLINDRPTLHDLKRTVLQDVAALNIYEQEQFLARARQEAADINEKIAFISEEIDGLTEQDLIDEIRTMARAFKPIIKKRQEEADENPDENADEESDDGTDDTEL